MAKSDFNEFRFGDIKRQGLEGGRKQILLSRVSSDNNIIVVDVPVSNVFKTKFGFMLALDTQNVIYLKKWQVNANLQQVVFRRDYFNIKNIEAPIKKSIQELPHLFDEMLSLAKSCNPIVWEEHPYEAK